MTHRYYHPVSRRAGFLPLFLRRPAPSWTWLLPILVGGTLLFGDAAVAATTVSKIEAQPAALIGTLPDWDQIRSTAGSIMTGSPAGTDPLVYFVDPLGRQMGLPDAASTLAAKKLPPALAAELKVVELAETARHLVRNLAAWNVAKGAQDLARITDEADAARLSRHIRDQAAWLSDSEQVPYVRFIMASIPALTSNGSAPSPTVDEALYRDYAASLDAQYPALSDGPDSWLAILERDGVQAWHARLAVLPDTITVGEQDAQALAGRYAATRLRPLLRLSLAQQGSQLETWAAQQAYRNWLSIYEWKDSVRLRRGLARLCGSWQWTIHNHQNHGEQKLTVSFPSPSAVPDQGGPAEIVVLGDLVYLRWEAGGRVQEDSLLFSKEGQRLEGTFVNNMGGWGSVTGKRTTGCSKK